MDPMTSPAGTGRETRASTQKAIAAVTAASADIPATELQEQMPATQAQDGPEGALPPLTEDTYGAWLLSDGSEPAAADTAATISAFLAKVKPFSGFVCMTGFVGYVPKAGCRLPQAAEAQGKDYKDFARVTAEQQKGKVRNGQFNAAVNLLRFSPVALTVEDLNCESEMRGEPG